MSYYPKEEQETLYLYDPLLENWQVQSTYPPHIKKLLDNATITDTETDEEGRVVLAVGYVNRSQVRLYQPQ